MRRLLPCLALTLISGAPIVAQNVVANWFPLNPGDQWTYDHETRDDSGGGRAHLEIHRWTTQETILRSWPVPQGTVVERQVRLIAGALPAGYRAYLNANAYLIRGNCIYTWGVGWDPQRHQLKSDYVQWLDRGEYSADFCFPLGVGETWGAPHWGGWRSPADAKDWQVTGMKPQDPSAPDRQETFHITSLTSYLGSGMSADVWFAKGVGLVREDQIHHGTIGELHTRLVRFEPVAHALVRPASPIVPTLTRE